MRPALAVRGLVLLSLFLAAPAAAQPLVVIDAGHGGSDPGAVGCSLEEAAVVLDVAQRLQVLLEGSGVRVALTRDSDTFVDLSARAAFANARSATGFVSIHSNSNAGTPATGTETFVYPGSSARTQELGAGVQAAMLAAWGLRDRGLKEANFAVLRETTMPAALGELAFTNNCTTDAPLLGDPTARQSMAEHLHDAVMDWLGVAPMPSTGTLRGVVYEDQGVGAEDLTVRLPGASVRVVETGASATAAATDAAWSFALPPGEYTVEASIAGHVTATRTCSVVSGMTSWCSVGLFPEGATADGGIAEDAGAAEDAGTAPDAAAVEPDAGPSGPGRESVDGCGCTVVGGASRGEGAGIALAALGLVLAVRRRRRTLLATLSLALLMIGASGCARDGAPVVERAPLGATDPGPAREEMAPGVRIGARPVASLGTVGARREWLAEGFVAPVLSPEGSHVLLASPDHGALFVLDLQEGGGPAREICRVGRCGWEPRWQDGGAAIAYRTEGQSGTAVPAEAVTLEGEPVPVRVGERGVHAWTDEEDRAWLREGGRIREVGPEGERVMMPSLTADRRHVAMWGLTEGVLVHRVWVGGFTQVGRGGPPRVDPSGRWLVFERTEDDGHRIVASDLFVVDLGDPSYPVAPLVATSDRIERMPSLSRVGEDGVGTLAYLEEGALIVREVRLAR